MKKYWKINLMDKGQGNDGFSVCVSTEGNETEDSIVDLAIENGVIDKYDLFFFYVSVEEITNDSYEMRFWKDIAVEV